MQNNFTNGLLHFLLNSQKLFQLVEGITGCDSDWSFLKGQGLIELFQGKDIHDGWHSDMVHYRCRRFSINLSEEIYSGGILQIREP